MWYLCIPETTFFIFPQAGVNDTLEPEPSRTTHLDVSITSRESSDSEAPNENDESSDSESQDENDNEVQPQSNRDAWEKFSDEVRKKKAEHISPVWLCARKLTPTSAQCIICNKTLGKRKEIKSMRVIISSFFFLPLDLVREGFKKIWNF